MLEKATSCADETELIGAELAKFILEKNENFIALYGDLGAGKTAFTRGFASVIAPDADVCSPTYTIVNEYDGVLPLFHFDMYRIEDEDSLDSIGFYDYFGRGIIITEWSENIPFALPERYIRVNIEKLGNDERKITAEIIGD
ncbi:MAG: tRNA (adenosine(37)-N6)-threonylcarbamoyltransferase complex ATPase subunit type 1 TsaE [Clostridia bacterium]|nr:tRNA (adenosine(37)-N6)-threonylcarbamoyltransferase complex ATPase subunit type 1 TsaE [Clostridia bacterium]